MPEGETANSLRFVFPTICTWRSLAIARHAASVFAGGCLLAKNSEPAEVTWPFRSMLSFTANLNCLLPSAGGQYEMKAWAAGFLGANSVHPPKRNIATGPSQSD